MPKCCVVHCPNAKKLEVGASLFIFPIETNMRQKWIDAVRIDPKKINDNLRVCHYHFADDDVFKFSTRRKLKAGRTPHINLSIDENSQNATNFSKNISNNNVKSRNTDRNNGIIMTKKVLKQKFMKLRQQQVKPTNISPSNPLSLRSSFLIKNLWNDDVKICHYTGLPSCQIIMVLYNFITNETIISKLRKYRLSPLNQLFLTLMRLKRGLEYDTLSYMFLIPTKSAHEIFKIWLDLLHVKLSTLDIFPHRDILFKDMPVRCYKNYPYFIGSIDCIEFSIETSAMLASQYQFNHCYKSTDAVKALLMISSTGIIVFTSPLFSKPITDDEIFRSSGFYETLTTKVHLGELLREDLILADKGINICNDLPEDMPKFHIAGMQFRSPHDTDYVKNIVSERVNVERAIQHIKSYKILSNQVPVAMLDCINKIYCVCAHLSNLNHSEILLLLITNKT